MCTDKSRSGFLNIFTLVGKRSLTSPRIVVTSEGRVVARVDPDEQNIQIGFGNVKNCFGVELLGGDTSQVV